MKSFLATFSFFIISILADAQSYQSRLKFEQGQKLSITTSIKTHISQQAMGQAIDFDADGEAVHFYTVTNATDENSTLRHQLSQIGFNFDGMGQKRSFHSTNEKDMNGQLGQSFKPLLENKYDMIIDPSGNVLLVQPEKIEIQADERMKLISGMLKDMFTALQPPKKGGGCLFRILPVGEITVGKTWTDSTKTETGFCNTNYIINNITDTTIVVDVNGNGHTEEASQMMGMDVLTKLDHKFTGQVIIDKTTGLIREKKIVKDSVGNSEAMGGNLPVNSKTTIKISVKPGE